MTNLPATRNTANKLQRAIGLLAALGIIDAFYLTWIKIMGTTCAGFGDCKTAQSSMYSDISGVPVAALGLAMYSLIGVLVWLEAHRPAGTEWLQLAVFGLALVGLIFSGWLTYVQIAILQAICPYCAVSAMLISAIFTLSAIDLVRGQILTE
ncbi:MAG: vitamin K epoxide reductase family protein [Anaerolineales bacterium]|jgi:uncharacterized membrane protein|nr:vitamin K epoxide reductase family protein [Anaerolineales bacterium]